MSNWVEIACEVAEILRHSHQLSVYSGASDMSGVHGPAKRETTWCLSVKEDYLVLKSREDFDGDGKVIQCRHWVPARDPKDVP